MKGPYRWAEAPAFINCGDDDLFGVLSWPSDPMAQIGFLLLGGSEGGPSAGKTRTLLARRIAGLGFPALRIDYAGTGESSGTMPTAHLDPNSMKRFTAAATSAAYWLYGHGVKQIVVAGICFGSRVALTTGPALERLAGLVLMSPPILDEAGNPERPRQRLVDVRSADLVSPNFLEPLEEVLATGTPVLMVYGSRDDAYPVFQRALTGALGRVLEKYHSRATVHVLGEQVHGFPTANVEDNVIDLIGAWMLEKVAPTMRICSHFETAMVAASRDFPPCEGPLHAH